MSLACLCNKRVATVREKDWKIFQFSKVGGGGGGGGESGNFCFSQGNLGKKIYIKVREFNFFLKNVDCELSWRYNFYKL